MAMIAEWQYPDSRINGATMADAATMNRNGERTVPSILCKTVMTTKDPMAKVIKYYETKLKQDPKSETAKPGDKSATDSGRSVMFHDDSQNRPLAIHIIVVNTDKSSTTLVISRGETESETHIAWTRYLRFIHVAQGDDKTMSKDLSKIQPPGGVPLPIVAGSKPETPAEYQRHRENLAMMKEVLAGPEPDEKKLDRLAEAMRREPNADHRRDLLALAAGRPAAAQQSFLIGVLQSDADCTVRSQAAKMLGRSGSEAAIAPLANAAASDAVTVGGVGSCLQFQGTARRSAIFALAELGRRLPNSRRAIEAEIRKLPEANDGDKGLVNEHLGDARRWALYQLTEDRTLLAPDLEKLKSTDAKTRSDGVVAFRFLNLTKAPRELVELARDPSPAVRNWVVCVLGEIGDAKTVPLLMALAKEISMDRGTRCGAIEALGRMRATDAQSLMEALLSDDSLKTNAAIALSQITGKRHPLVPEGYGGPDWPDNQVK
ncbi:MAG: HEAT repeat domain-containing protein [Thermoguttaceae bacterium]|jgi:hypothetical protein